MAYDTDIQTKSKMGLDICLASVLFATSPAFDACSIIGPEPHNTYKGSDRRLQLAKDVFDAYIEHHSATLERVLQQPDGCARVPAIVFKANAGLGDTSEVNCTSIEFRQVKFVLSIS